MRTLRILPKVIIFLITIFCYVILSTLDLNKDVINPDGINWHNRSKAFAAAILEKKFDETYQAYHPGITLMWISAFPLNRVEKGLLDKNPGMEDKAMFLELDHVAKLSVVVFSTLIFAFIFILLWKLVSFKYATFFSVLFTLEPFLIGMRRLYHLDYLLTILLFLSFLLLIYYSYKSAKWYLLLLAGMSFASALLTKSSAVMFLPFVPAIILLGNGVFYKKLLGLLVFIISSLIFVYAFFPGLWQKPLERLPRYAEKIAFGVTGIGISGYREMGTSGTRDNVIMSDLLEGKIPDFYLISLFSRTSPPGIIMFVLGLGVFIYFCLKWPPVQLYKTIKNKVIPTTFNFKPEIWISFWSLCFSLTVFAALSIAVKKSDRYEIIIFPFLITLVAYFLNRTKLWLSLVLVLLYICFIFPELINIHPYYLAYSNPYLGGIETRLNVLDGDPFGVGSHEAFNIICKEREKNGEQGFYTVSGSKSIKAIAAGGKFSRAPSCVTDYVVTFALNDKPTYTCAQDYVLIGTVKIDGYDYWYVYRRLNQMHESNYE